MTSCGVRSLLAASAAAAVLSYGVVGHGLSHAISGDGMVGTIAGLCLLLATVLGIVRALPVVTDKPAARESAPIALNVSALPAPLDDRARASPITLQRFRN